MAADGGNAMEEVRTFAARFSSVCNNCRGRIEVGEDIHRAFEERQMYNGEWRSTNKAKYFHGHCAVAITKMHSHEGGEGQGFLAMHPLDTRHRQNTQPTLHPWMSQENGAAPVVAPVAPVAEVDLSAIESRLSGHAERLGVLESEAESKKTIEVKIVGRETKDIGRQHESFPTLVAYVGTGVNVAMKGPAGSFKTHAAGELARALDLPFYAVPLGPQTSKSDLIGYRNGAGDYVRTLLREAYENGGVCLLDEMDAASPAVLVLINSILSNGIAGFADGMVKRHPDCIFVAAMNTFGRGADAMYVGRAQLDAATLDRWVTLEWNYDWDLTRTIAVNDEWVNYVELLSDAVATSRVRVVISPRAAMDGARLLAAGIERTEVEQAVIWAPISEDDQRKIRAQVV